MQIKLINNEIAQIIDTDKYKVLKSEKYNFFFSKTDGLFIRWGKAANLNKITKFSKFEQQLYLFWNKIWNENISLNQFMNDIKTDGDFNITTPEIVDWEISEKCDANCKFCYKSNVTEGNDISFDDFKTTFHKLPITVTTIAYGIGSIKLCENLFDILEYTKSHGVIPTITINGDATDIELNKLVKYCGAVAVSAYSKINIKHGFKKTIKIKLKRKK